MKRIFITELELKDNTKVNLMSTFVENKAKNTFKMQMRTRNERTQAKHFFFNDEKEIPMSEYKDMIKATQGLIAKIKAEYPLLKRVIREIDYTFKATTQEDFIKELNETGFFAMSADGATEPKDLANQTDEETAYQTELAIQQMAWSKMKGTKKKKLEMLNSMADSRMKTALIKHLTK